MHTKILITAVIINYQYNFLILENNRQISLIINNFIYNKKI